MEPAQTNSKKKIIAAAIVLFAIALLAIGAKALTSKNNLPQSTAQHAASNTSGTTSITANGSASSASPGSPTYKNGTYMAIASYDSPGGNQSVALSITLENGTVTASNVTEGANGPEALEYQQDFISGYKAFVIGKNIDNIRVSHVSGSSLTSIGFNSALNTIKDQAKP